MTALQRRIVLALTLVIALSRFAAVSRAMWDWDEALFTLAVQSYDVTQHRPHPPGYPLFIAAAKAVHALHVPEFRSLQVVVVAGAIAVFPAAFFLAMELGFGFAVSIASAAALAFMPNVWVYGGTGFSDVPALALALVACALLLRGRRDARAYVLGAVMLALSAGIRPPNLLLGLAPGFIATWHRLRASWRPVALAAVLGALIAGGSYLGAALASDSVRGYRDAIGTQTKWVREVDSWENRNRPPLKQLARLFLLEPVQHDDLMYPIAALAAISLAAAVMRRRSAPLLGAATFGPLAAVSWIQLDFTCAGRYAISYIALHAFLAADGLHVVSGLAGALVRKLAPASRRARPFAALDGILATVLSTALVLVLAIWTWPALTVQRTTNPPPVQALLYVLRKLPPDVPVYVHGGLGPHTDFYLANRAHTWFETDADLANVPGNSYVVQPWTKPRAVNFERPHGRLWKIVRQRHFEASVLAISNTIMFGQGWYGEEGSGADTFRWMAKEGRILLPPVPGMGTVAIRFHIPGDLPEAPDVDVIFNGQTIETIRGVRGDVERRWTLLSRRWTANELRIVTSATANPKRMHGIDDDRELGLSLRSVTWFATRP